MNIFRESREAIESIKEEQDAMKRMIGNEKNFWMLNILVPKWKKNQSRVYETKPKRYFEKWGKKTEMKSVIVKIRQTKFQILEGESRRKRSMVGGRYW